MDRLKVIFTNQFKKDVEKLKKQNKNITLLKNIMTMLENKNVIPPKNKDHQLKGNMKKYRELHIEPDWLLVYKIEDDTILYYRTASHSELF